ncbi:MAG: amino acid permease [bacterium]|nr:amino acid permease [bacterium]
MNNTTKNKSELKRQLNLFDSTMIMVGIVIGSGIFLTTGIMAASIPSASMILLVWLTGGLLTLAGALTYAELGAAMPEAGGQYVYLKKAYGPLFGFLFGWVLFLVYIPGAIAALSAAFAEYTGYFFPKLSFHNILFAQELDILGISFKFSLSAGKLVAIAAIIFLTVMNYIGTRFGKGIQNVLTVIKIGALFAIVILGFTMGKGQPIDYSFNPAGMTITGIISGFALALVAVSWAFDGWNNINFVAGEIKNPQRNIPLAMIWGTVIITVLYVLVNYIYLYALPIDQMAGEIRIAEKAATVLFGGTFAAVISAAVVVSTFGSLNGTILAGPRVFYAMAKDGLFFKRMAAVHPKYGTPAFSIAAQAVWACILALSGTFEELLTYVVFVAIIFWISAAFSVFTLRKKFPDMPRPYKTWGYPVVPALFIIASFGILINTLLEKPMEALAGLVITIIGVPVYFYWKRKIPVDTKTGGR